MKPPRHDVKQLFMPRKMQTNFGVEAGEFAVEASTPPTPVDRSPLIYSKYLCIIILYMVYGIEVSLLTLSGKVTKNAN